MTNPCSPTVIITWSQNVADPCCKHSQSVNTDEGHCFSTHLKQRDLPGVSPTLFQWISKQNYQKILSSKKIPLRGSHHLATMKGPSLTLGSRAQGERKSLEDNQLCFYSFQWNKCWWWCPCTSFSKDNRWPTLTCQKPSWLLFSQQELCWHLPEVCWSQSCTNCFWDLGG